MNTYLYEGPVSSHGLFICNVKMSTRAVSKEKAISNFTFQYKKQNNLLPTAKIELDTLMVVSVAEDPDKEN